MIFVIRANLTQHGLIILILPFFHHQIIQAIPGIFLHVFAVVHANVFFLANSTARRKSNASLFGH